MQLKYFYIVLFYFIPQQVLATDVASVSVMALSAASSLDSLTEKKSSFLRDFFSPKGGMMLEKISFTIEDHMNNDRPIRLHLVIAYDESLSNFLGTLSSKEYFSRYKQITKDYPDKIKILEWQIPSEKRKTDKIYVEYESSFMTPTKGFIFASYDSFGEHRMTVPPTEAELEIRLDRDDFNKVTKNDKKKALIEAEKNKASDLAKGLSENLNLDDLTNNLDQTTESNTNEEKNSGEEE